MKHTRKYRDEALGRLEVAKDFLPPPDQLVLRDDRIKITIGAPATPARRSGAALHFTVRRPRGRAV